MVLVTDQHRTDTNGIPEYVQSRTKLVADDFILHHKISTHDSRQNLQHDLDNLTLWEDKWGMKFHPDKYEITYV